ncbi:MAG: tetratricopeptide repeat protein [Vicinamibacteria bacterium]|nr:tetratricopeptide repeat protein [Vicinamibacteria bacterium]
MTNRLMLSFLLALACLENPVNGQIPPPGAEAYFESGNRHLRNGRMKQAIEEFKRALKLAPKNPYYMKGLGIAYLAHNDFKNAIEIYRKILEINPYYVDARNDLGTALILSGKREEGKQEILNAFQDATNPTPEVSARNLGQAFYEERKYAEALQWFQASAARNATYPDAHVGMANALISLGRLEQAVVQLEQAARDTREDPEVVLALGEAFLRAGRFTDARQRLEQLIEKEASSPRGRRAAELLKAIPK